MTRAERQVLKAEVHNRFPAVTDEALRLLDHIGIRAEAGRPMAKRVEIPGLLSAHYTRITPQVHGAADTVVLHELAHQFDVAPNVPSGRASLSPAFALAIEETLRLTPTKRDAYFNVWLDLRTFPGLSGNPLLEDQDFRFWGGPVEAYADIYALANGNLALIPPPLRPFYDRYATMREPISPEIERPRIPPAWRVNANATFRMIEEAMGTDFERELIGHLGTRADDLPNELLGRFIDAAGTLGLQEDEAVDWLDEVLKRMEEEAEG